MVKNNHCKLISVNYVDKTLDQSLSRKNIKNGFGVQGFDHSMHRQWMTISSIRNMFLIPSPQLRRQLNE
jgi:hypothetical protein